MLLPEEYLSSEVSGICAFSSPPVEKSDGIKTNKGPETTNARPEAEAHEELRVTFVPPLHDARRVWILGKLRQEQVNTVSILCFLCLLSIQLELIISFYLGIRHWMWRRLTPRLSLQCAILLSCRRRRDIIPNVFKCLR